jgi:UDP-2-acetamido-3-amino-2,3-dideoxy-glucuronate N-acetyltransferase
MITGTYTAHDTAVIDDGAVIGAGTRVWHWTHVCGGAVIGRDCSLGQNVFVGNRARIGDNVKIQNNVSVYEGVTLEEDVFCGPSVVFTNVLNPRSRFPRKGQYRATRVRRGATLGANCTIVCGVEIGQHALIGAGAVVTRNVPPFALFLGVPARQTGWMSRYGDRLPLPLAGDGRARCPHTGDDYLLSHGVLRLVETGDGG